MNRQRLLLRVARRWFLRTILGLAWAWMNGVFPFGPLCVHDWDHLPPVQRIRSS